jgi:hypothetical protein
MASALNTLDTPAKKTLRPQQHDQEKGDEDRGVLQLVREH